MKKKLICAVIAILVVAGIVFMAWQRSPAQVVRIGYLPISNSLPLYVALEEGLFDEEHVSVELVKFQTSNDLIEALVAGRIDVEVAASTAVIYEIEAQSPGEFKVFSVNVQTKESFPDYIVAKDNSSITSIEDLKGKKLGTFPGSTFGIITRLILQKTLPPDSVIIEELPASAQVEALAAGHVDAVYTMEPFSSLAVLKAGGRIIESAPAEKYVLDPLPAGVSAFSSSFTERNQKSAEEIVKIFDGAVDLIRRNESKARKYLAKYAGLNPDIADQINIVKVWKSQEIDSAAIQKYADILFDNKGLGKKIEATNLLF